MNHTINLIILHNFPGHVCASPVKLSFAGLTTLLIMPSPAPCP